MHSAPSTVDFCDTDFFWTLLRKSWWECIIFMYMCQCMCSVWYSSSWLCSEEPFDFSSKAKAGTCSCTSCCPFAFRLQARVHAQQKNGRRYVRFELMITRHENIYIFFKHAWTSHSSAVRLIILTETAVQSLPASLQLSLNFWTFFFFLRTSRWYFRLLTDSNIYPVLLRTVNFICFCPGKTADTSPGNFTPRYVVGMNRLSPQPTALIPSSSFLWDREIKFADHGNF